MRGNTQYKPPTPEVFGNEMPADLPTYPAPSQSPSSFNIERPRSRPKLQDRLAVYEDDNPRCQRLLCVGGFICFPLWFIGAIMYIATPDNKLLTREAGFKNLVLSLIGCTAVLAFWVYHVFGGEASASTGFPSANSTTYGGR